MRRLPATTMRKIGKPRASSASLWGSGALGGAAAVGSAGAVWAVATVVRNSEAKAAKTTKSWRTEIEVSRGENGKRMGVRDPPGRKQRLALAHTAAALKLPHIVD
jgi:hypothetical protein